MFFLNDSAEDAPLNYFVHGCTKFYAFGQLEYSRCH